MIRRNQNALNILNGLTDGVLNVAALCIAYWFRFYIFEPSNGVHPFSFYLIIGIVNGLVCIVLYALFHLYEAKRRSNFLGDVSIILRADVVDILLLGLFLFLQRQEDFSRLLLVFYFVASLVLVLSKHTIVRKVLYNIRQKGYNIKHVLLIGSGTLAEKYLAEIEKNPQLGYKIVGWVNCGRGETGVLESLFPVLGNIAGLDDIIESQRFDEAVIALDEEELHHTKDAIEKCNLHGLRFSVIPFFTEYCFSAAAPDVQTIGSVQVFDICASPLDLFLNRFFKRALDIFAAALLLCITSPVLLVAVIGVKLSSRGPILFKQERVGLKKDTFYMYKFRSMRINMQQDTAWSQKGDPRVTAFGKFIRKTSIDELPQLVNILKGDMSLVGPRPEIPHHVAHFKHEIPYYMARHQIRPGLTGWAQINGYRGDTSIEERIQYDLYYIYNWSFLFDIRIIFKTAFGGMLNK